MNNNAFSLSGKKILVTGASSGIGYECCTSIVQQGGTFIAVARREDLLKELVGQDGFDGCEYIKADLGNENDIAHIVDSVSDIDGVVHCAGMSILTPIKFYKQADLNTVTNVNYYSIVMLLNHLLKKKKVKRKASIVLISSISNKFGALAHGYYAASKAALTAIARVWANELSPQGIRVNTISPGMVTTDILDQLSKETMAEDEKKYPLGYGKPSQIAQPVVFLLSDASSWITGQDLIIDGGRTAVV